MDILGILKKSNKILLLINFFIYSIIIHFTITIIIPYLACIYSTYYPVSAKDPKNGLFERLLVIYHDWFLGGEMFAAKTVIENKHNIVLSASKYNLDPDLIRAIIFEEMSHADIIEQNPKYETFLPEYLSKTRGIMQVKINSEHPHHKSIDSKQASINKNAIDAGAFILKNEINELLAKKDKITVEMIASKYNNPYTKTVTNYGRRVESHYKKKSWNIIH